MQTVIPRVLIGGIEIKAMSFRTQRGTYGSIGRCVITTSITELKAAGLIIPQAVQGAPTTQASLPIEISASLDGGQTFQRLFIGDLDTADYSYLDDMVEIAGRDYAGRLYDRRIVLKSNEYVNQRPWQIAQSIANDAGIPSGGVIPDNNQQLAGFYYTRDAVVLQIPRPAWDILVYLARAAGTEVGIDLTGTLFFRAPSGSGTPYVFTWKAPPNSPGIPAMSLKTTYQPRRNMTFQVVVLSYHPKTQEVYSERIIVLQQPIAIDATRTARAGVWAGAAAQRIRSLISNKMDGRPIYVAYAQGKTLAQCQNLAEQIYKDVARKLVVATGEIDGLPALDIQNLIQLQEYVAGDLQGFSGATLSAVSVGHRWQMPAQGGKGKTESGLVTEWAAHYLPAEKQAGVINPLGAAA